MGTINYGTSDYITMGIKPYDIDDFMNDTDFMNELQNEMNEYGSDTSDINEYLNEYIQGLYEADYENGEYIINRYKNDYFHVVLKWGYYEGLYVDIESNNGFCFNDWKEKRDAQKAITQMGNMLNELANVGFVACACGWVMGYADYNLTQKHIKDAIREMRDKARTTPTWLWYERNQHTKIGNMGGLNNG